MDGRDMEPDGSGPLGIIIRLPLGIIIMGCCMNGDCWTGMLLGTALVSPPAPEAAAGCSVGVTLPSPV
jgi:hypothetical protein